MFLPKYVQKAISNLEQKGFEAYVVGGCVRNSLLKRRVYDYDITTSALPHQIKDTFKNYKTIDTGILHGTVTVIISGKTLEITTFRQDGSYNDFRHPSGVTFLKNLEGDLSRRDFTVNCLAYNQKSGIIDLFGGQKDLESKILRTVGNANERFSEDALRILRGMRFCAQHSLAAEENTKNAMIKNRHLLSNVSKERIFAELKKLICSNGAVRVMSDYKEVFSFIMPEFIFNEGSISALKELPKDFSLRFAALFSQLDSSTAVKVLSRLKCDNNTIQKVSLLLENLSSPIDTKSQIKRLLCDISPSVFLDLLKLKKAVQSLDISPALSLFEEILQNKECYLVSELDITGDDLLKFGFKGKEIGAALKLLLDAVIEERLPNEKQKLISFVKEQK